MWAINYGHRRYLAIVGPDEDHAGKVAERDRIGSADRASSGKGGIVSPCGVRDWGAASVSPDGASLVTEGGGAGAS